MNFFGFLLSAEFIRAFAWTLLHSLWQGGLIALIAAGLMMILHKHRPAIRYAVLYGLMLLLPVLFIWTLFMVYNPANSAIQDGTRLAGPLWQPANTFAGNLQSIPVSEIPRAWYVYLVHLFENQAKWLVLLWFTGFIIFLIRFAGSFLYVYRLKNYQLFQVEEKWNENLRGLSARIGLHRAVKLVESALARIPLTIGYLKPVILLPLGTLSGVPPQQIEAILLHELAHIRRKDYILNIIQSLIELLFFYHPVTWWLTGMIRQEREHICDDLVVAVNQDQINYIKALTTMEELNSKSPFLASAMADSRKKLLFRVKRLLNPVKLRKGLNEGIIAFILLAGLIFAVSMNALSFIPDAYDLSGRESGEKVHNLFALDQSKIQPVAAAEMLSPWAEPPISEVTAPPDTIVARSKSGKVVISVYTDSTSQLQQENLSRVVENLDKQAENNDKKIEEYEIQVRKFDDDHGKAENERKIVIIKRPDTTSKCPELPDPHVFGYQYSYPGIPDLDSLSRQFSFSFGCDSLDTLILRGPDGHLFLDNKDLELSSKEWEQQMKDFGIDMEKQQRDMERFYRDQHNNIQPPEPGPFFYSFPPVPPDEGQWKEHNPGPRIAPSEKIIRQELIDDGLASPRKKYVIDLNSKGMYINGEKQSKEVFRKYKHLVESLDLANLESEDTYRLIF